MMKSGPDMRPERETLTTRPEVGSQATPAQAQQSEEGVHVERRFDGSEVILCLNPSKACLSTWWQDWDGDWMRESVRRKRMRERGFL